MVKRSKPVCVYIHTFECIDCSCFSKSRIKSDPVLFQATQDPAGVATFWPPQPGRPSDPANPETNRFRLSQGKLRSFRVHGRAWTFSGLSFSLPPSPSPPSVLPSLPPALPLPRSPSLPPSLIPSLPSLSLPQSLRCPAGTASRPAGTCLQVGGRYNFTHVTGRHGPARKLALGTEFSAPGVSQGTGPPAADRLVVEAGGEGHRRRGLPAA